jgi:hypothetical protein
MSYLPHPFLESHILAEADADPHLTRRVLDACSIAPGQRNIGRRVEARLRARELKRLSDATDFQALAELRGFWLPGIQGADGVLLAFSEAGRYLTATQVAFNPHHQLKHLAGLAVQLNAIENQLRANRNSYTQPFEEPLEALRRVGQAMRSAAEEKAAGLIPNPFRAGNPLSGEEGPELFRGRENAVRDIEEIFSDATCAASLQLLAPRRAGKTSLLKMLPRLRTMLSGVWLAARRSISRPPPAAGSRNATYSRPVTASRFPYSAHGWSITLWSESGALASFRAERAILVAPKKVLR